MKGQLMKTFKHKLIIIILTQIIFSQSEVIRSFNFLAYKVMCLPHLLPIYHRPILPTNRIKRPLHVSQKSEVGVQLKFLTAGF